jgi:16S rRNA (guanine527-N7)-methyltransferase
VRGDLDWFASRLHEYLDLYVRLESAQVAVLHEHYRLLQRWNAKINLTSIRSPEEIVVRHYCESLFFAAHIPDVPSGTKIADIGSGAGFPGVPMAVLRPDWQVTLVESHQRKAVFLRESTRDLPNVAVLAKRAEQVELHFDWLVSRAVAPQEVFALVPKLASCVGLLMGDADLEAIQGKAGFVSLKTISVPWGERRVCAFTCVSRST